MSLFTPVKEDPIMVKVPCIEDLLGDKLTAFAPNSTGIPYYKGEDSMSMEIIKQLYDIGNLFDRSENLKIVKETFCRFSRTELSYRKAKDKTETDVIEIYFKLHFALQVEANWEKEILRNYRRVSGGLPDSSLPKTTILRKPLYPHPNLLSFRVDFIR